MLIRLFLVVSLLIVPIVGWSQEVRIFHFGVGAGGL